MLFYLIRDETATSPEPFFSVPCFGHDAENHYFCKKQDWEMTKKHEIDHLVEELFSTIEFRKTPEGLYDPLRYMISIGGKRIRPTLCLLAYSIFKNEFGEEILEPAAALEVFHTFTLIHDDIMDRSPLRRKMPTVWKKWDEDHAILSGDVMLIDAYQRLSKRPTSRHDMVFSLFSKTAAEVCEGQQYDMDYENIPVISMKEYEKMIGLKTAVLLACSAEMGALLGEAAVEKCEALYRYGYNLGMAFQIADDYLDAYGDEKVFGKPIGGDIINAKKSWLTVRALEKLDEAGNHGESSAPGWMDGQEGKTAFLKAFEAQADTPEEKEAKISSVRKIYDLLGVPVDAKAEIVKYSESAMKQVENIGLDTESLSALRDFAESLVGRAK